MEQTSFSASGTVKTADGKEIIFNLQISMERSYHEESSINLKLADAGASNNTLKSRVDNLLSERGKMQSSFTSMNNSKNPLSDSSQTYR